MKQAVVFLRGIKAGILTEDENGYTFAYDANYLASADAEAVSLTLPLSDKPYRDKTHRKYCLRAGTRPPFHAAYGDTRAFRHPSAHPVRGISSLG